MATPHEPERTCVGCRDRAAKRDLIRIARTPEGTAILDPRGRAPGRGAYVHRRRSCVDAAWSGGTLWRALKTHSDADAAARLRREMEGLLA